METISDRFMKDLFRRSTRISDRALRTSLATVSCIPLSLMFWNATGSTLFASTGLACFIVTALFVAIALFGQTTNQVLRGVAWVQGRRSRFFEAEKPLFSRHIGCRFSASTHGQTVHVRRNHARSHRSASRSASCSSSKTSSDDGESDQGDCSDPGDLPSSSPSVTSSSQTEKSNRPSLPWLHLGTCRIPRRKSAVRGCSA